MPKNKQNQELKTLAQTLREETLQKIVTTIFEKMGFETEIEPNLYHKTPDIRVIPPDDDYLIYVELKAYSKQIPCLETELGQGLNYNLLALKKTIENIYPEKSPRKPEDKSFIKDLNALLKSGSEKIPQTWFFTSGKLPPEEKNAFFCRPSTRKEFIKKRNKELKKKFPRHLKSDDDFFRNYKLKLVAFKKKFEKYHWFEPVAEYFKYVRDFEDFKKATIHTDKNAFWVVGYDGLSNILDQFGLKEEKEKLEILYEYNLEQLMENIDKIQ